MKAIRLLVLAALAHGAQASPLPERSAQWGELIHRGANLYRVSPTLFRSARLRRDDVGRLQQLGIKTVVNLRAFHSDAGVLRDSGIKPVRVPINTWAISDRNVVMALVAIRKAERDGPVLLHCLHGADRTGLVTAMYRIIYQQRSKEDALAELKQGGYGYHAMWRNIEAYLRMANPDKIRARVEQEVDA